MFKSLKYHVLGLVGLEPRGSFRHTFKSVMQFLLRSRDSFGVIIIDPQDSAAYTLARCVGQARWSSNRHLGVSVERPSV